MHFSRLDVMFQKIAIFHIFKVFKNNDLNDNFLGEFSKLQHANSNIYADIMFDVKI